LESLQEEIKGCRKCALAGSRTNVVVGDGSASADALFVGEAPGFYEDREGKPFVGAAGQLLERLLRSIGLTRADVYIANVLKCRPPQNRDPLPEEIEACKPFLFRQIEIIKPKVICTLGNFATRLILEKNVSISQVRGKKIVHGSHVVFPIFHPAAALHASTNLSSLEEDFRKLKAVLAEPTEVQPQPEQRSLF
jgi:DNA polymerase